MRYQHITVDGFPHSEISGSKITYISPKHIVVSHVLHQLLMPRHPPYALTNLITILNYPNLIEIIKNLNCFIATTIKHITLSSFQRTIMRENSLKTKQNIQVARYGFSIYSIERR